MTRILFLAFFFALVIAEYPEEDEPYFEADVLGPRTPSHSNSTSSSTIKRWPTNTIHYQYSSGFQYVDTFEKAMSHISSRTCIRFQKRFWLTYINSSWHGMNSSWFWSNSSWLRENSSYLGLNRSWLGRAEKDYLYVTNEANKCNSMTGFMGGPQYLYLGERCDKLRTHIHELVHAIGFKHEHSRPDRDQFVTINEEHVRPDLAHNFEKLNESVVLPYGAPYDYRSILHYSRYATASNGTNSITPLDPSATIGTIESLSEFDVRKINNMYCQGTQAIRIQNVEDGRYLTLDTVPHPPGQEARRLISVNWTGENRQKWTVDWHTMKHKTVGSFMVNWEQYGARLTKALEAFHLDRTLIYDRIQSDEHEQKWWVERVQFANYSTWQIGNLRTGLCIGNEKLEDKFQVSRDCNKSDTKQLWKIYLAYV